MSETPRTNLYAQISEKDFTAQVIALARWYKWRVTHFRAAINQRGRWLTPIQGDSGFPDIFALRHNRAIIAELKAAKGRVTPEQVTWLSMAKDANLEVYIWRPADIDEIEGILK